MHTITQEVENMAIVATYHFPNATVHIDDSYLTSHTPEQIQRNREEFEKVCWTIIRNNEIRAKQAAACAEA